MRVPPDTHETLARPPTFRLGTTTLILTFAVLIFCSVATLGAAFFYLYTLTQTTPVTLVIGGENRVVNARVADVGALLQAYDITLYEGDQLSVDTNTPLTDDMVVEVSRARNVTVFIDGETRTLRTTVHNPARILAQLGITLTADDRVSVDGTLTDPPLLGQWTVPANQIRVRRAVDITVHDGDTTQQLRTSSPSVGDALYDMGVQLYVADEVTPPLNTALTAGLEIRVNRAAPVQIAADGVTMETRTRAGSVGGLLAEVGVSLMGLDYAVPPEDEQVQPGMTVRVVRVTEEIIGETEIIPFADVSQADSSLELDQLRLVQPGRNGLHRTDTRVRYEDGVEVSRQPEGTVVVQEAQDRIVAYGTGVVVRTVDTPQGPREYWRKISMLTTSYHPAALGGDNITATGRVLTKGIVGVDPTVIPYGTEVYVPGYGVGVAADTGGPRSTRLWIDLGYDDENWIPWSQYTDVYILTPLPANVQYVLPD